MEELIKECIYELMNYPKRGVSYQLKRILKAGTGRGFAPTDVINWPTGLLANALMDYYKSDRNGEIAGVTLNTLKKYFNRFIRRGSKIYCLDDVLCGVALIDLQQTTGSEKYRQALDKMVNYLYEEEKDDAGSIPYRNKQKNNHIYADEIGMICPFLAKYGAVYGDNTALNLAVTHIENFIQCGMKEKLVLPYHGYEYDSRVKMGIIGWGRAVGWLMMGMVETLTYLPKDRPSYDVIKQSFRRIVDKVEAYQLEGGLYCWQLEAKEGSVDTSASAMIIYSIAKGLNEDILIGIHKSRMLKGRQGIAASIKDGKVYGCLAECQGFGMYPQIYGAYPWSLGPALSLFVATREENE